MDPVAAFVKDHGLGKMNGQHQHGKRKYGPFQVKLVPLTGDPSGQLDMRLRMLSSMTAMQQASLALVAFSKRSQESFDAVRALHLPFLEQHPSARHIRWLLV